MTLSKENRQRRAGDTTRHRLALHSEALMGRLAAWGHPVDTAQASWGETEPGLCRLDNFPKDKSLS